MNVTQLRKALEALENTGLGHIAVVTTSFYGDRCNTQLAHGISHVSKRVITYSDYHLDWAFGEPEEGESFAEVYVLEMLDSDYLEEELDLEGDEEE